MQSCNHRRSTIPREKTEKHKPNHPRRRSFVRPRARRLASTRAPITINHHVMMMMMSVIIQVINRRVTTRESVPIIATHAPIIHASMQTSSVDARSSRATRDSTRLDATQTLRYCTVRSRAFVDASHVARSVTDRDHRTTFDRRRLRGQRDDRPNPTRIVPRASSHVRHRERQREG